MISVEGYDQFGGHHWETGSVRNALAYHGVKAPHTGQPFSEAMLFGLSGGVGVVYFLVEYEGLRPHLALGTRYPYDPVENITKRLGLPAAIRQTKSQKKAVDTLLSALVVGEAALVWADMFSLSYNGLPPSPFTAMMPVVVYAYDIDSETVNIADRAEVPLTVSSGELAEARAQQASFKNKMISFEFEDAATFEPEDLPGVVTEAMQACVDLYTKEPPRGPASNFGLAAMDKWADLVTKNKKKGWHQTFSNPAHLYEALKEIYAAIEHRGSGGGAARPLYADFLEESAALLDNPALNDAAALFRKAGERWQELAHAALPDTVEGLRETREIIDRSRTLFKQYGNQQWQEMQEIAGQLETLNEEVPSNFPLDEAARLTLLQSLQDCIQQTRDAEAAAVDALAAAIAKD